MLVGYARVSTADQIPLAGPIFVVYPTGRESGYSSCRYPNRIIADLEQGVRPWMRPWSADHAAGKITRSLRHNGVPYNGINVGMLWPASVEKGYSCPLWLTFKQALELGGNVMKGGHGELVVYANRITRTETDEKGAEQIREIPFLKGYTVFNAEQCEGLPAQYTARAEPPALPPAARITRADRFFAATGVDIRHGGTRAYYGEGPDYVQMPPFETFVDAESHAATLAHELTHATKHEKRLARDMGRIRWGDEGYAKEELVELGAAFLSADLGITPEVRPDHATYIASWLGAEGRQAVHLHRRRPRAARRGLSAFPPACKGAAASRSSAPGHGRRRRAITRCSGSGLGHLSCARIQKCRCAHLHNFKFQPRDLSTSLDAACMLTFSRQLPLCGEPIIHIAIVGAPALNPYLVGALTNTLLLQSLLIRPQTRGGHDPRLWR
jgi:antirestriction protein ArdC